MALITYEDKQAMGTQPSILEVNKITDSNMNEIKMAINSSTSYSTTETICGTWLDKPLYRKVINFGALPNNTTKQVNHNIANIDRIVNTQGYAYASSTQVSVNIPYAGYGDFVCDVIVNTTYVKVATHLDQSAFGECYIFLEYTKTTD